MARQSGPFDGSGARRSWLLAWFAKGLWLAVAVLSVFSSGAGRKAQAQSTRPWLVGAGGGVESVPRPFRHCETGWKGTVTTVLADAYAAIPVGRRLRLAGRASLHWVPAPARCPAPPPFYAPQRVYDMGHIAFLTSDVRLGYDLGPLVVVWAGGGWNWGVPGPYLVASPEVRLGEGKLHCLLEADLSVVRLPYHYTTYASQGGVPIEISRELRHEWRSLLGIQVSVQEAVY